MFVRNLAASILLLFPCANALAEESPDHEAAKPLVRGLPKFDGLKPEDAAKSITLPKGFRAQLAAGEPLVHQPVAFTIDDRGRLWVAEAHTYPQRAPEGQGKDKIIILEDADGDGSLEKRKVFAEGLNLVSGLEVGFGGVWVGAAPYLLFIPDRNADDQPDAEPEVLLDGFCFQDTHETLNSFNWGPDGWLYGCHGVFTHSLVGKPGTPRAQRTPMNAAIWRYHPTRHKFEIFAWGTSNPWGVDFNDYGHAFATACVIPHLYHVIQNGRYQRQAGNHFQPYTFDDLKTIARHRHYAGNIADHAWWGRDTPVVPLDTDAAGGGHAHCGALIYLGDNWPAKYRNQIFMNNVHGNRVNQDALVRSGSGYVGDRAPDFMFANDRWFRGITLRTGPDGGVFVSDWYDKNACHRRQPEIWDRTNGRIYKITYGDVKPAAVNLGKLSDAELVALQLSKNDWQVRTARRVLQERHAGAKLRPQTRPALVKIVEENPDATRVLRAMWALHATGGIDERLATQLLSHASEYVRSWAIQLASEDGEWNVGQLQRFVELSQSDPSPLVRLYLASALPKLPPQPTGFDVAQGLAAHADDANDHNLPLLIWYGIEPLVAVDMPRALQLAGEAKIPLLAQYIYRRAAAEPATREKLLAHLGEVKAVETQRTILGEVVAALEARGRMPMPSAWPEIYRGLSESPDAAVRDLALRITVAFGDKAAFPALRKIAGDRQAKQQSRLAALSTLLAAQDAELPPVLYALLDDEALRKPAILGLARFDSAETPAKLLAAYAQLDRAERDAAIATLASRPAFAHALVDAIEQKIVPRGDLSAFTVGVLVRLHDEKLTAKLNRVWGATRTTPEDKLRRIAELKRLLDEKSLAAADRRHGRELFNKTCAKCHLLFGEGGKIGPDITGANRASIDYLLENMIDPSAVVGKDYQMTTIATAQGRVLSGLVKEQNADAVSLQTVDEVVVVPAADIDERRESPLSLMPEGQLDPLSPDDIRSLVAYLASPRQVLLPGEGPLWDEKSGRMAGAIEGESLHIIAKTAGNAGPQQMRAFKLDRWSAGEQLWWTGAKPGEKLVLEFTAADFGPQELFIVMTKAIDYGVVRLSLDDAPLAGEHDLYHDGVITTGTVSLGTRELKAGKHRLTVEIVGANPQAQKAYMFGLDYLWLVKKKE